MNQSDSRWLQIVRILFLQFFRSGWWHGKDTKFSFMSTTCMMGQVHDLVASTCLPPNLKIAPKTSRFLCKDGLVEVLGGDRRGIFWCCNRHHWGWPNTFWALWISPPQQKKQKQCHYFSCPGSLFFPPKNNLISSHLLKHNNKMCVFRNRLKLQWFRFYKNLRSWMKPLKIWNKATWVAAAATAAISALDGLNPNACLFLGDQKGGNKS